MNAQSADLWQRIGEFAIDPPGAQLKFDARLARENGWPLAYSRRVIEEYKRFVFLAMVAGHDVTPSDQVDEAWHLHLTYTHSYWNGLCRTVLGKPLHHNPTQGGNAEAQKHVTQYSRTLATYEEWFGHEPPPDIWPPADVRFGEDLYHTRVNTHRVWIVPKPHWVRRLRQRESLVAGAVIAPLMLGVSNPFELTGRQFLVFYLAVCIAALAGALVLRRVMRSDAPVRNEEELSPYEIACLGGGVPGLLRACLATLTVDGRIQLSTDTTALTMKESRAFRATQSAGAAGHEIEQAMIRQASEKHGATAWELLNVAQPAGAEIYSKLQSKGLLESRESFSAARWWPVLLLAAVWMVGLVKVVVGLQRDRPVLFLILILIALLLVTLWFLKIPLRTRRGEALFRQLRAKHDKLQNLDVRRRGEAKSAQVFPGDLMLAAGLFGLAAVHHPDVDQLNKVLKSVDPASGGGGCSTSGGCGGDGGGCGGGCGGCGGGD